MKLLKLEGKKDAFFLVWTIHRPAVPPAKVSVALKQAYGFEAEPCVEAGDKVLMGQKIAEPGHIYNVAAHSPVSGKVSRIHNTHHPVFGKSRAIEIISDGLDEKVSGYGAERSWEKTDPRELPEIFREAGLVDMNLKMKALHAKLGAKAHTLVLNACESEPYLSSNYSLTMSHPLEVLKGAEILRRAAGAEKILFVTEQDKREAAELIKSKIYFLKWNHADAMMLPSGYPDDEALLTRRMGGGPYAIFDLAAAFAVYEAVALGKPLLERVVTVSGECVMEPKNVWARIGAEFSAVVKTCKGFMREPRKLIMGGPMGGRAQTRLDVPVVAGTQGILALPNEVAKPEDPEPCIRCGRCLEVCPSDLSPAMITLAAENDLLELAGRYNANDCVECGNCSFVCPSKRPMTELMRYANSGRP